MCFAGRRNCPWVHPEDPEWAYTRNYVPRDDGPAGPPPLRFGSPSEELQPRSAFKRSSGLQGLNSSTPAQVANPPQRQSQADDPFDRGAWGLPSRDNAPSNLPHRDTSSSKPNSGFTPTAFSSPLDKGKGRADTTSNSGWGAPPSPSQPVSESKPSAGATKASSACGDSGWGIEDDGWDAGGSGWGGGDSSAWGGASSWDILTQDKSTPLAPPMSLPKKSEPPRPSPVPLPHKKIKPHMPPPPPPPTASPVQARPPSPRAETPSPRAGARSPQPNAPPPQSSTTSPKVATTRAPDHNSPSKAPRVRVKPDAAAMAHHPKRAEAYVDVVQSMLTVIRCKVAYAEAEERYEKWRSARHSSIYAHASASAQQKINDASADLRRTQERAKVDLKKSLAHLTSLCAEKDVFTPPPSFDVGRDYAEVKRYTTELNAWLGRVAPAFASLPVVPDPEAPATQGDGARAGKSGQSAGEGAMDVDTDLVEVPQGDLRTRVDRLDAEVAKYKRDEYDYGAPPQDIIARIEESIHERLDRRVDAAALARKKDITDYTAARIQDITNKNAARASESVASLEQIRANQLLILKLREKKAENEALKQRIATMKDECEGLEAQVASLNIKTVDLLAQDPVPVHPLPHQEAGVTREALMQHLQPVVDRIVQEIYDREVRPALEGMSVAASRLETDVRERVDPHLQRGSDLLEQLRQAVGVAKPP
ncbi:hypothetical protein HDZ31DRAFT_84937 [Schizophyllum fasciatum]